MAHLFEKLANASFSRRDFLKGSAAAAAAVAGLSTTAWAEEANLASTESTAPAEHSPITDNLEGGEWIAAACWHNCGGRCLNKAYVKDGVVLRQKSDDTHEDSWEYPQQRACLRGRAQRMQIFSADRIKYPMKRKNWSPDAPHPELRGKDEWERLSWDEAIELAAGALKNTYDNYGANSVLSFGGGGECNGLSRMANLLNTMGGSTTMWTTGSLGVYMYPWTDYLGINPFDMGSALDRMDMMNADIVVLHGLNSSWSANGLRSYIFQKCRDNGVKFIAISPDYNVTAQMLDAVWIPVNAGTDTAFMLGAAYAMIEADSDSNPIIDHDFLDRCTVGFDAEHMPADAKLDENFKGYLMGEYDGIPKTPEWAEKICGAPAEQIRWYAQQIGKDNKVCMLHGYAPARCKGAENFPQMFMTLAAMGGHFGKSGHCAASAFKAQSNNGVAMVTPGGDGQYHVPNPVDDCIGDTDLWRAVNTGKYPFNNKGSFFHPLSPAEWRDITIKTIVIEDHSPLNGLTNIKEGIEAITKEDSTVDFILTNSYSFRPEARYADIIFPVTTMWERYGRALDSGADRECLFFSDKVIEPLFEAKSDREVAMLLAEKLGYDPKELYPTDEKSEYINIMKGTMVFDNGEYVPLVTLTAEDYAAWGVEGEPQQGKIGLDELRRQGVYQVARTENDGTGAIAYEAFCKDPEANPLPTASGKFQIYSQIKADNLNATGMGTMEFKPYPNYAFEQESYETTFTDFDSQQKGEYPYVAFNPHYLRRAHSIMDNNVWLREAAENPVFINRSDAEAKGIVNGDSVKIWNRYGAIVRNASVTGTIKPGMLGVPHGAWNRLDSESGIDFGGNDNILCGGITSNSGVAGYNNYPVNFEKFEKQMPSDSEQGILLPGLE